MNENGQKKMLINLLSISQTLIALNCNFADAALSQVRKFFGLYEVFSVYSKLPNANNKVPPRFKEDYAMSFKMSDVKKMLDLLFGEALQRTESVKYREHSTMLQQIKTIYDEIANDAIKQGSAKTSK